MSCQEMSQQLLETGWRCTDECYPKPIPEPVNDLRAIRLFPPESNTYFIEFLNVPEKDQIEARRWIPLKLADGWYGLPSFRFLGIVSIDRIGSHVGLEYAAPQMMALANLLSHPQVGTQRIKSGSTTGLLRSAKDLGRVIALAYLAGREETEAWHDLWLEATQECFPEQWKGLLGELGNGLNELLHDQNVIEEVRKTTDVGILNGMNVSAEVLQAIGERLMQDVIEPLRGIAKS